MRSFKAFLVLSFTALCLVACGGDGGGNGVGSGAGGGSVGGDEDGGYIAPCTAQIVEDYNTVVYACEDLATEDDAKTCKAEAQEFVRLYPNLKCLAASLNDKSVMVVVRTSEVEEVVRVLTEKGI